jgi:hypothetical protein
VTSPVAPGPIDQGNPDEAADALSRIVAGNAHLVTHPHLVTALYTAKASPEQAQAINQFVGGLSAKGRVMTAMSAGVKINLSADEKAGLDALGVDYSGAEYTEADAKAAIVKSLNDEKAKEKAKRKHDDDNQSLLGGVWDDVTDNAVTHGVGKAWNWTSATAADTVDSVGRGMESLAGLQNGGASPYSENGPSLGEIAAEKQRKIGDADARAMRLAGYDPGNPLSVQAYRASGKDIGNVSDLYDTFGTDQVDAAIKYADDPQKYVESIVGNADLTAEDIATQLQVLQSKDFEDLVTRVNARHATIGNSIASFIDPVAHPNLQKYTAAGIDMTAMFAMDPTLAVLGGVKAVKLSKLMLDSTEVAGNQAKVRNILNGTTKGLYANQVRRGMTSLLGSTKMIREGLEAGDDAKTAAGYAKLRAETPGLEHLAPDFLGGTRAVGFAEHAEGGLRYEKAAPITTLDEAADYLSSTVGMVRLVGGKPLTEGFLMPGQLSRFGYKKLRGSLAAGAAARGVNRDAKLLIDLRKPGMAGRVLPSEDDAVDVATGAAKAGEDPAAAGGLKSALRGEESSVEYGKALKAKRTGVGPSAVAARSRLVAQRFASFLPRTTTFSTHDPEAVTNVFRYGRMYLTYGRANLLAAAYAAGDEGARKAILTGMELQTLHAAGLGTTTAGRAILSDAERSLTSERYASNGDLDRIVDPLSGEDRAAALWDTQVNTKITLTGFQDIQKAAAKIGIWESTLGRAMNSQLADNIMGIVKPGWLITGTNVVRNSGEDLVGAALRGEYGDVSRAKAVAESNGLLLKRTKMGSIIAAPLARVAQLYRHGKVSTADESLGLGYIASLSDEETHAIADGWTRLHAGSMIDPGGARRADEITKVGFVPRRLRLKGAGFAAQGTEDLIGADRLSATLGRIINDNPEHAKVVLDHIENGDGIEAIVGSLKASKDTDKMIRATLYQTADGSWERAVTAADKELALRQLAEAQVKELAYLMQGRDGALSKKLTEHVRTTGKAPDTAWIMEHLTGAERPITVNAPLFEAVPVEGGVNGFVGAIADLAGEGYRHLIERSISRMSTMPIFLSHYGKARFALEPIEKEMVAGGLTAEAAASIAKNIGMDLAWKRTVKYIDDGGLRTQMDVVGRNFFAFSRATQAFIRRWGTQFVEDPARLQKLMLTMEGAQHTGLTYTDENGDKQFVFPGSGAAISAFQHLESLLPGVDLTRLPVAADFTGKVALLQPGLQNPMQMSMTPLINFPMRTVFNLFPEHRQALDEVDAFLNGPSGVGRSALGEFIPTAIKKFTDAVNPDERDSMMAGATRQAILNLTAAGQVPPANADAAQRDEFLQNLKVQVKNQLLLRAVIGFFTPAPPGQPSEGTDGSESDWFYGAIGIKDLDSEYKKILNEVGGDPGRASAIWAGLHPDKTFYSVGTTSSTTKSATVAATKASEAWLEQHLGFMQNYKGVSAYFIPTATQDGSFDLGAYNSQLELGLRQHKSLEEFYTDVRVKNAEDLYFQSVAARDAAIKANPAGTAALKKQFAQWSKEFKALNPLFAEKSNDYSTQVVTAQNQLRTLRRLVTEKPSGIDVSPVQQMVDAYDSYHKALADHPGSSNYAQAIHKSVTAQYDDWMHAQVAAHPQYAALYQGVFRTLDSRALTSLELGD